ncbi:recombinase family protein [Streptomyces xanthophaeus]
MIRGRDRPRTGRAGSLLAEPLIRPELKACHAFLGPGDTLVVPSLDRYGRSLQDLISMVAELRTRGIGFTSLHENLDTTTPARPRPLDHLDRQTTGRLPGPPLQPHPRPARATRRRRAPPARSADAVDRPQQDRSQRHFLYANYSHPEQQRGTGRSAEPRTGQARYGTPARR